MSTNNTNIFTWDPVSAGRKLFNDSTITIDAKIISVTKNTPPNDPNKDAYRNCKCGKHYNYHKNGECPK